MNFYLRIGQFKYELINENDFNNLLKDIIIHIIKKKDNKFIEISILIQKFKQLFKLEEMELYILDNEKYKLRNINTYIKSIYGSFNKFLIFNGIEYQNMICIKN